MSFKMLGIGFLRSILSGDYTSRDVGYTILKINSNSKALTNGHF